MLEPISVIIPALNEEISMEKVIVQIKEAFKDIETQIIVVDDGSDDHTGEIARKAGAEVLCNPIPNGYGNAIKKGIVDKEAAIESLMSFKRSGASAIVTYFALDIAKKISS